VSELVFHLIQIGELKGARTTLETLSAIGPRHLDPAASGRRVCTELPAVFGVRLEDGSCGTERSFDSIEVRFQAGAVSRVGGRSVQGQHKRDQETARWNWLARRPAGRRGCHRKRPMQ
jgi:hypothetical protein